MPPQQKFQLIAPSVEAFNDRIGKVYLLANDIQTALGYKPLDVVHHDATLTGDGTLVSPLSVTGAGSGFVTSFNTRTGAVVSQAGDYTTAMVAEVTNLYFTNARAIAATLTGYTSGAGTVSSSDSVLSAIQKLNGNTSALVTGVSSVFGRTGAVTAQSGDYNTSQVTEVTNLYFTQARAIASPLTGYVSGSGTVLATDTILQAVQKLNGNIGLLTGALIYQGTWDASTNTPTLASGVGTKGYLYKVSVAGTTNLDGISTWNVGDIAVFNGTVWDKIDGIATEVLSVNGLVGNVPLTGTANRLTVSAANVFDISATFEALLGKVANPLSQFAATTSAQLAGVISDETGSGLLVFNTSPTLVTPILGVASATSINKMAITAPATASTLAVADGKTFAVSNSLTFTGVDTSSVNFGAGGTMPRIIIASGTASTALTGTTAETNLVAVTIPGGVLNANGHLVISVTWKMVGVANTKTPIVRLDTVSGSTAGTVYLDSIVAATTLSQKTQTDIIAQNSTSAQAGVNAAGLGVSTLAVVTSSINTASPFYVNINGKLTSAADTIQVIGYRVELINP